MKESGKSLIVIGVILLILGWWQTYELGANGQAFQNGEKAALEGKKPNDNPYWVFSHRVRWLEGWISESVK